jgi:hypothetical protein
MHKSFSRWLWATCVILIILGTAGCDQIIGLPTFTPTPSLEPTATATAIPTATPEPPEGPYPPVLLGYEPRSGQEVAAFAAASAAADTTAIKLYFDQPMDQASVVAAFRVTPALEGDFEWPDVATLVFRPRALAALTRYRVALVGDIRSAAGLPLSTELSFAFSTLAPLTVTRVQPAAASVDARIDAPALVVFNRAVVPLACVGQPAQAGGDCPTLSLNFEPAVLGTGMWVETSIYRFDSLRGWAAGRMYTATLAANVVSVDGATLTDPVTWSFSTAPPVIQARIPDDGQVETPLETDIRVIFNTPMDQEITASVFSVTNGAGEVVPGAITWEDNGAELVFTPWTRLSLGTHYTVQVGTRARAATSAPLEDPQNWTFTTASYPAFVASVPQDGATGVDITEPVRLVFSGALNAAMLAQRITISPTVENPYTYFDTAANVYTLSWDKQPQTEYCVQLRPGIADVYGNVITQSHTSCFVTGDLPAFIGPADARSAVTLDASQPSQLLFWVQNRDRVSFTLSEVPEADFVRGRDVEGGVIREWQETFTAPRNTPTVVPLVLRRLGGALPAGYYHLAWENPPWGQQSLSFAVVDRHLTLKLAAEDALVWVTELRSAEPVTRTAVRLVDPEGLLIAAATTDDDGLARIPIGPRSNLWENVAAVVGEPGAAGFGVALTSWTGEAAPSAFGIVLDGSVPSPFAILVYTDRASYQPGEVAHFRGILREEDGRYLMPSLDMPVQVTLREVAGRGFYTTTVPLSDMGTFTGVLTLPESLGVGDYVIETSLPGDANARSATAVFAVVAPRETALNVSVTPDSAHVLRGDPVRVVIAVDDTAGIPVAGEQLTWAIYAQSEQVSGESVLAATGEAETDADGRFVLELPAEMARDTDDRSFGSQLWTIEAAVHSVTTRDALYLPVSGQGQVTIHPSRFYLSLQPREWVARAGVRTEVSLLAHNWEQQPVAGQEIDVSLTHREWYHPEDAPTWSYTDTVISTVRVTTDFEGQAAAVLVPPRSGTYIVAADALDADAHPVHTEIVLWVSGADAVVWPVEANRVTPVTDARVYNVGDRAKILLPVAFDGPYQMLMTVERDGILSVERRTFDTPNPVIEIPMIEAYVPNVYVSFVLIRGVTETVSVPEVRAGYVTLKVAPAAQTLTVTALSDKATYRPGDTVTLTVSTVDAAGRPANAEIGVALVDQALLARGDSLPSLVDAFYGVRPLKVMTGAGLLMLSHRSDEVARLADAAPAHAALADAAFADAAHPGHAEFMPPTTGARFADTVLWEGDRRTGANGETRLSFVLPDRPATWVAVVYALTADTKVGEAHVEIVAEQPLRVQPVMPRFLVVGDQVEVAAVVYNRTDRLVSGAVQLTADVSAQVNASIHTFDLPAGGRARVVWTLSVAQSSAETVALAFMATGGGYRDGVSVELPLYRYVMPDVIGTAGVLDEAGTRVETVFIPPEAGDASALLVRVAPSPVGVLVDTLTYLDQYPYASTDVLIERFASYVYTYRTLQELGVSDAALMVRLQTSIAQALERLYVRQNVDGSWGWWEGQSTRKDFALHLTAFATLGLVKAERAGFAVRQDVRERALAYIYENLVSSMSGESRHSYHALGLYVLSDARIPWPAGAGASLYSARESLGVVGRAYLALALGTSDPSDSRLVALLDGLRGEVKLSAAGAHWEDGADSATGDRGGLHWNTDVVVTSIAADALARFAPDDLLLAQAVRWLMVTRRGGRWQTTYETAWAITGLSSILRATAGTATAGTSVRYDWSVALNGVVLTESTAQPGVSTGTVVVPWRLRAGLLAERDGDGVPLPALWRDYPNLLEITRGAGTGYLYYAAHPQLSAPVTQIVAESRGLMLRREYCADEVNTPFDGITGLITCRPLTGLRVGEQTVVRLTLISPQPRAYVRLEVPHPAGLIPLETDTGVMTACTLNQNTGSWAAPIERCEVLDDRVVFFISEVAAGTYQMAYLLRAVTPGTYGALPAVVSEVYFPEVWGRSAGDVLRIAP